MERKASTDTLSSESSKKSRMGVNKLWRTALLNASRNLRQNVLKGRIWPSPTASPNPNSSDNSDIETKAPTSTENVYGNTLYASSDSSLSSAGEVEDIVATPFTKAKRSRVKVRERVRDFEERSRSRSASEVSDSDNAGPAGEGKIERVKRVKSRPLPVPPTHTTSPVPPAMHSATPSPNPGPSVRRQLPKPPFSFSDNEEEPSMEALLAQADRSTWGARAWEEIDDGVGIVTVKHVPGEPPAMGTASGNATLVRNEDWMKGTISRGTGKTKERGRGRVVTSIFQGLDEDGQGISRESSGDSEESAGVTDVSSLGEVEKDTTVLVAEPLVKDAEVQSLNGNTVDAEVQSPVVVTADAEVQSLVISTVDAEVQLPIISTTDAEVQSPVILTADAQVQSPVVPASDAAIQVEDQEESDKLKGVIQQLERKLEESKLVIEDFKKRLEGVEMESVKEQVSPSVSVSDGSTRTSPDSNAPVVRSPRTRVGLAASLVSRMFGLVGLGSRSPTAGAGDGEMGVGDLPSYVFLVGLGVCAVVLKVIVKRVKRGLR
ncbi:hypothetical protein NEOLEDRAFT_1176610 [Neolentinus lepideus HHB14362 ss-1]|uniref:Uncharacterized protein n=1 Tax=Neolentinus lepideus HHB14362 ss-1 TaxID=1314782 RepID=A0A165U3S5_9AGAM|nr:hypothetical protein NEOLEDRAFT_1176610 [Neolentinus lepideus HHB14362 ss-1]